LAAIFGVIKGSSISYFPLLKISNFILRKWKIKRKLIDSKLSDCKIG
jgi:hypothetical protein